LNDRPLRPPLPTDSNRSPSQPGRSVDTRNLHQRHPGNPPPLGSRVGTGQQPVRPVGNGSQQPTHSRPAFSPQGYRRPTPGQSPSMTGYGQVRPQQPTAAQQTTSSRQRPSAGQYQPSPQNYRPPPVQDAPRQQPAQPQTQPAQRAEPVGFIHSEYAARFGDRAGQTTKPLGGSFLQRLPLSTPLLAIPRRVWFSLLFCLLLIGSVSVSINLINRESIAGYVDTSLPQADQTRQRDLHHIKQALRKYYDQNNNQFPIMTVRIGEAADSLAAELVPLYIDNLPRDPDFPEKTYHYSSLTGKSFRLSAMFEDGTIYALDEK